MSSSTKPTRPILRYFGGKWKLAPWIIKQFPPHRIYCEAFGGGASVLLRKDRAYGEVYNDLDDEVVNVFRVLQKHPRRLKRLLEVTPFSRQEWETAYVRVKDPVERARRAIIRSFMGFGSDSVTRSVRTGFRSNSNRSGTTPAHDWCRWPHQIELFHDRLAGVVIENRDAMIVMASQDGKDTLHYVDPPYVPETRKSFQKKHGYACELDIEYHQRLIEFLKTLQGMVVLSGYSHPLYDSLEWTKTSAHAKVFHAGGNGHESTEILWLNPAAVAAQKQIELFG